MAVQAVASIVNISYAEIYDRTVADGATIEQWTPLTLSDPRTVAAVSATNAALGYVWGGFAATEKVASDTKVTLGCVHNVRAIVTASGSITVGNPIKSVGSNYFGAAVAADVLSGVIAGKSEETATDGQTFLAYFY